MAATGKNGKSKEASPLLGKYEVGRFLGRGNFAKVYHARSVADGVEVAVKVIDKPAMLRADMAECVLREVKAMRRLRHPHVLRIHEVLATRSKIYLVMEYAPGGDLMARLVALPPGRHFAESMVRRSFMQLAAALMYCHARGVAHRDIKPHNVLLDADGNVKVADFGLAALSDSLHADGRLHTKCGTPGFVAPEILCRQAYDGTKADAWSCGVILFILLTGRLPFEDLNNVTMLRKMLRREYTFPEWVSQSARRLIHRLVDPNPNTRLAVAELVNHSWFKRSFSLDSQLGGLLDGTLERALEFQAPALTAFDIISMSPGLDLSGLLGIRRTGRQKRFITSASPEQMLERLGRAGVKLGYVMVGKKGVESLPIGGLSGLAAMSVEISEVSPPLMLVEMRLETVDGDGGGEGQEFGWEELRVELGDVVRHSCQDL